MKMYEMHCSIVLAKIFSKNVHDSALIFTLVTCPLLAMATLRLLSRMVDSNQVSNHLFLEDVTVHAGQEVLMDFDKILLIDGN